MSIGKSATPIGKVRGLGSAREGGEHWITERVTSIALLLLGDLADRVAAVSSRPSTGRPCSNGSMPPSAVVPMALLIVVGFRPCARRHEGLRGRLRP